MVRALGYIWLGVKDLDAWKSFLTDTLGLEYYGQEDEAHFFRMCEYMYRIALVNGEDRIITLGWEVANEKELRETFERLKTAGYEPTYLTDEELKKRHVLSAIQFSDETGITHEIYYGPSILPDRPFKSPRPISGFKTGELGMGHIVLGDRDISKYLKLYLDVLNFKLTDIIESNRRKLIFLRCNKRHHTVALAEGVEGNRGKPHHIMFELKNLDDVCSTYYLCLEKGILASTLGRHSNDLMISFYVNNPSGFSIEYGWGGITIDDATWSVKRYDITSIWGHLKFKSKERIE